MGARQFLYPMKGGSLRVTDVPQSEADALMVLYNDGGGPSWTDNTGWGTDPVVDNWFGVTVAGGHVTDVDVKANNGAGNILSFDLSALPSLEYLSLRSNSFSGNLSSWTLPAGLEYLSLRTNSFSGNLSSWTLPAALGTLYLNSNSFTGDLSSWTLPATLLTLNLNSNSFTGDLSSWSPMAAILVLSNNSFSGVPDISSNTLLRDYQFHDNALNQANVDAILASIYARRAAFTDATPKLNIGGTNQAPSGAYADEDPPVTGLGYVFELATDPETEGFNTWSITYTGGTAP